jgi:D-alanyl-D-alanine carboxypeptidase
MVVDVKTGRTLHAQNEDAVRHPASITKVMTLYLLFEQLDRGRIGLSTRLRISANAAGQAPSKLGLEPGDTIAVEDAIKALITKSANDVAVVVAENLAGSEEAFAEQMTRKARALGMSRTIYRNASGLPDPEQVTTARDLTMLARAIQDRFPRYYRYFKTHVFHFAGEAHRNHNKLLGQVEGVDGIKTGFTRASGFNLMTNVKTADRHIVAVVLGGRSGASRDQAMASLVRAHLPRAYAGLRRAPLVAEGTERARPGMVAEAGRANGFTDNPETTSTLPRSVTAPLPRPLDLNAMRAFAAAAAESNPTPSSSLPSKASLPPPPRPAPAMAEGSDDVGHPLPPPNPAALAGGKIQARLPSVEVAVASLDAPRSQPPAVEPPRRDVPRGEAAKPTAKAPAADPIHERLNRTLKGWVIQLGATDDESKAKAILEKARSRSGRALAKASAFTEKVVREGATLYRARFSGFEEADAAQDACKTLKRNGFNCFATRS